MISVFGAGSWGSALTIALARNNTAVAFWGRAEDNIPDIKQNLENPKYLPGIKFPANNIEYFTDLQLALQYSKDLLIVVPSKFFVDFIKTITPYLSSEHRIGWATKGLDPVSNRFFHSLIPEITGKNLKMAALSGPSFAKEVAINQPSAVTVASDDADFAKDLGSYFHNNTFNVYLSDDLLGVQLGGVYKNILAVASGIVVGLDYGLNTRATLLTRGIAELIMLAEKLGAKRDTILGLSGIGDVILTCTGDLSRNRSFGLYLAQGLNSQAAEDKVGQVVEAKHNIYQIHKLASQQGLNMPIVTSLLNILDNNAKPQTIVDSLFNLEMQAEL